MLRIALQMLQGDRPKYLGAVFGVLFTSFLITLMLSMFTGFFVRVSAFIDDTPQAEIWVMDPAVEQVDDVAPLRGTALHRVRGVAGVAWAVPLYSGTLRARLPDGKFRGVQVVGIDDATLVGAPPASALIGGRVEDLRGADAVIIDADSARKQLRQLDAAAGPGKYRPLRVGDSLLINDHRAVVVALAHTSPRLISRPTAYTLYSRAVTIAPPERTSLSFVLVKAKPGLDRMDVAARITAETGLRARTAEQFRQDTWRYVLINSGVLIRMGLMVGIAVIVGFAVSAQVLYMFTLDKLREYAVLMAMGASNRQVLMMVVAQAMLCGAIGFGLGLLVSTTLGIAARPAGLPFEMVWPIPLASGVAVVFVCIGAGAVSARRVMKAEPGMVFR